MIISQDFKEFLASLNDRKVQYLVVGGYAVAFHGHPRYTKDLDIWFSTEPNNVSLLLKALDDFGFASLGLKDEDLADPDVVIQLGYPPHRIDLITGLRGVDFQDCYRSRVTALIEGVSVPFIDLENLKKNKQATGRHQDLADLDHLK